MEIWKEIPGFEGYYEASTEGRIRSVKHYFRGGRYNALLSRGGKVLKPSINMWGYQYVSLSSDGKNKKYTVHRLVAKTFLLNPNNYSSVNHKDENKTNNRVDNLEWCTKKYNANYGTRNTRVAQKMINNPGISKRTLQIDKTSGEVLAIYPSANEAARQTGISKGAISQCLNGRTRTSGGYVWKHEVERK